MNLTSTQIKDTYGNLLTIGTVAGTPTTGTLQNGAGSDLTSITLNGAAVFNEGGGNFDFRVEGDTDANLLFVDASADNVGIGTNAPLYKLMVGTAATSFLGVIPDGTNGTALRIGGGGAGAGNLRFLAAGDAERMRLDSAGVRLWIGNGPANATPVATAQIEATGGNGTDIAGTELRIKGGASTGSAAGGAITFYTSAAGASGTTVRSQAERLRIDSNGGLIGKAAAGGHTIFNEDGIDADFRVEGDTDTHLIFADASTDRVGIGESTPTSKLHVAAASGAALKVSTNDISNAHIATISGATKGVRIGASSTGGSIEGVDNTGTASFQPLTLGGSDIRFSISGASQEKMRLDSSGNVGIGTSAPASILNIVTNTQFPVRIESSSAVQCALTLSDANTTSNTSTSIGAVGNDFLIRTANFERLRITSDGNVKIGGSADRATTEGTNQLVLFDGTAPVGTLANGVSFYSASGEANVMDAAGNATLLSPHDKDTNEWIFRSKHTPTGKVLKIDVERMLRFINDHFGLDMIQEFTEA